MTGRVHASLFDPASVAIVGLSADPTKHGGRVLANLRRLGYAGSVYGVNPRLPEVDGVAVAAALGDLPVVPDVVVCAVPAAAVAGVVEQAGAVGAKTAVVFAGGFAETGTEGRHLQDDLVEIARRSGISVLGPNSGGVIRPVSGMALSFLTCLDRPAEEIRPGPVGLVTQSGGTGSYIHNLAASRGGGLAASISTGNEADVDLADGIDALVDLDDVRVVALVVETVRDGPAFLTAVRRARAAGKPVVACRLGRSERGRRLMTTHTGALASNDVVVEGVFDALGITMVQTPEELYDVAEILARVPVPSGPRIGVVTHSGGVAILLSDLADDLGVQLPAPGDALTARLDPLLDHGAADNPLDMGGIIGGPHRFAQVVEAFADDYDAVLAVSTAHPPAHTDERVSSLLALDTETPIVHLWMAGDQGAVGLAELRDRGVAATVEPRAAMRAMAAVAGAGFDDPGTVDLAVSGLPTMPLGRSSGPLTEHKAKAFLASRGIPVVAGDLAASPDQARDIADRLGYPVVVKISSPDIHHKTEVGALRVGVANGDAVVEAFEEVMAAGAAVPGAAITGVRVERMVSGPEVIVGAVRDPVFGPIVLVGTGGVAAEAFADVAVAPAPVGVGDALRMVQGLRGRSLLVEPRRGEPADERSLASIVSAVGSIFVAGQPEIAEMEINPLAWTGTGWEALDALIRLEPDPEEEKAGEP